MSKEIEVASTNFPYFLERFVYTQDEHDQDNPIKLIPEKQYIRELAQLFQDEPRLLVEKSRQMMVSWIAAAFSLWFTMFNEGTRTFIQSKKEKDANALLDRVKLIYDHLPKELKDMYPTDPPAYCKMTWKKRNSIIEAIPQGQDVLRQYTSSLIISDETAFQDKSEESFMASQPTLVGGGRYIGISSPNFKEFFWRAVKDQI